MNTGRAGEAPPRRCFWKEPMEYQTIIHPFEPVFDAKCRVLILGSLPSVKSRQNDFYYGHPQNRFWRVLAAVLGEPVPRTIADKKRLLLTHHIALWDVLASCEITGSADSSIKNAVPNDLSAILSSANIRRIYTNGKTSKNYYKRFSEEITGRGSVCLPSTSPANAAWSLDRLINAWKVIAE